MPAELTALWIQPTLDERPTNRRGYTLAQFIAAARKATTIADLCRALGIVPRGGNYETVRRYARKHAVDLSHLERAIRRRPHGKEVLVAALDDAQSSHGAHTAT